MITTYLRLIWAYLQIGLFGFGGGYAMLSLIQGLVVGKIGAHKSPHKPSPTSWLSRK